VELGELKRMHQPQNEPLESFLVNSFSRVGQKTAREIIQLAGLKETTKASKLDADVLQRLQQAMPQAKVPPPPANQCLSPIGEVLNRQGS
jgi:DNA topoisomerase-6 subunit B